MRWISTESKGSFCVTASRNIYPNHCVFRVKQRRAPPRASTFLRFFSFCDHPATVRATPHFLPFQYEYGKRTGRRGCKRSYGAVEFHCPPWETLNRGGVISQMIHAFSSLFVFPALSFSVTLWGHDRPRRQVSLTQLFCHGSSRHLHSHSLP